MAAKLKAPPRGEDRRYTASDVRDKAGMSYRQLNDWESKGALPSGERAERGWRRFTGREVFVIMVCAEFRRRFGVSAENLRWIQKLMLQKKANHFEVAVDMMDKLGLNVFIVTDFSKTFIMEHELEFADFWEWGGFGAERPSAYAMLNVNPLVNKILGTLKEPIELENHWRYRDVHFQIKEQMQAQTQQEIHLLRLIRDPRYKKLEISLKNGQIQQFWADEEIDPNDLEMGEILASEEFQTLKVTQKHGDVVRSTRRLPIKPEGADLEYDPKKAVTVRKVDV